MTHLQSERSWANQLLLLCVKCSTGEYRSYTTQKLDGIFLSTFSLWSVVSVSTFIAVSFFSSEQLFSLKRRRISVMRTSGRSDRERFVSSSPSLLDGLLQQLLQHELLLVMLSHQFVHLHAVRFLHGVVFLRGKTCIYPVVMLANVSIRVVLQEEESSEDFCSDVTMFWDQHGPWCVVSSACSVPSAASSSV